MDRNVRNLFVNRVRVIRATGAVLAATAMSFVLSTAPARSHAIYEPLGIVAPQDAVAAGDSLPLSVDLEGPSPVQIYSYPAGVVSYSGDMTTASGTVSVATNPNTPAGTVTVYVSTGGSEVVSTTVTIKSPHHPSPFDEPVAVP